jgi:hypothetical protein
MTSAPPLMILIAGPYRSGTGDDPALMEANLRSLDRWRHRSIERDTSHSSVNGSLYRFCGRPVPGSQGTQALGVKCDIPNS